MRFSCVVPAFNESDRVVRVLATILSCDDIDEVIVVDDGSLDDTWDRINTIAEPRLTKIRLERNQGKTKAIFTGIQASSGTHIVMIDADLIGLRPEHIRSLILPIKQGEADATLSLRQNSLSIYKLLKNDFVSGERVIPRELLWDEEYYLSGPGFGLEVKINEMLLQSERRVKSVFFPWVIAPRKSYKCWYIKGTAWDIRMIRDILSVLPAHRLIRQLWRFYRQQDAFSKENKQ